MIQRVEAKSDESGVKKGSKLKGAAIVLGGLLFIAVLTSGGGEDESPSASGPAAVSTPRAFDKTTACTLGKDAVKDALKAPSTAKFPDEFCTLVEATTRTNEHGYTVWTLRGPVDAENSFGAMLRSTYVVEITDLGDGNRYNSRVISIE